MGCPCNSPDRHLTIGDQVVLNSAGEPAGLGMYQLATFPECTEPYSGERGSKPIFVVGRGVQGVERLFVDGAEAANYALASRATYIRVPARSLCSAAVEPLLSA